MNNATMKNAQIESRINEVFSKSFFDMTAKFDWLFGWIFIAQWLVSILLAVIVSPKSWAGEASQTHIHVYAAIFLGGLLATLPAFLNFTQPGATINRYVNTVAQMLFSILLIHLTGGRIETHFHIFGSLAFLAFYRDWKLIVIATAITAVDHLVRGIFWPESVYGVLSAAPWRSLEHAAWVIFEDIVLIYSVINGVKELRAAATKQVDLELALENVEIANREAASYRYALDNFAIVAILDPQGNITNANENFCNISKYSKQELIGKDLKMLDSSFHPKESFMEMWKTVSKGKIWEAEVLNKAKDGHLYWVNSHVVPLLDANGEVEECLAISQDISDRKKLELDLKEFNHSLEETVRERTHQMLEAEAKLLSASKMSSLGEMAGGIAHEINNPLGIIKLISSQIQEIMEIDPFEAEVAKEKIVKVIRTTDRIAKIVQGLRSFSRDGSNDPFQEINVKNFFDDTLSLCMERMKNHEIQFTLDPVDDHWSFQGRSTEISQVLVNLLNNASDAIDKMPSKWIKLSVDTTSKFLEIRVTDSGAGIPLEVQKKLFQPFFTTKEIGKGTGLGLSISHGIVKQHGGELIVDSKSPNTCFVIRLPKSSGRKSPAESVA